MKIKFYCYPTCSTCKAAKKFLDTNNIEYDVIDIKKTPPTSSEIENYHQQSDRTMKQIFNTSGNSYRALNLKDTFDNYSDQEKYDLLSKDGMLIKRPILVTQQRAFFGFKPDEWQSILK